MIFHLLSNLCRAVVVFWNVLMDCPHLNLNCLLKDSLLMLYDKNNAQHTVLISVNLKLINQLILKIKSHKKEILSLLMKKISFRISVPGIRIS